jgi:hypothetical protein
LPSTVTTTRPDEATGFRHIGDPANALIARINATQHRNVVKMHDAIDGWVKEANRRGGDAGVEYLSWCAARIENNRVNHADHALGRCALAKGNDGLGPMDFEAASLRIAKAVRALSGEAS